MSTMFIPRNTQFTHWRQHVKVRLLEGNIFHKIAALMMLGLLSFITGGFLLPFLLLLVWSFENWYSNMGRNGAYGYHFAVLSARWSLVLTALLTWVGFINNVSWIALLIMSITFALFMAVEHIFDKAQQWEIGPTHYPFEYNFVFFMTILWFLGVGYAALKYDSMKEYVGNMVTNSAWFNWISSLVETVGLEENMIFGIAIFIIAILSVTLFWFIILHLILCVPIHLAYYAVEKSAERHFDKNPQAAAQTFLATGFTHSSPHAMTKGEYVFAVNKFIRGKMWKSTGMFALRIVVAFVMMFLLVNLWIIWKWLF